MSASEYGGAPFLGIAKPVFKAHGNSDAAAIKNAIRLAREYILENTGSHIEERIKNSLETLGEADA